MNQTEIKSELKKLDEIRTYEDLVFRQLGLITYIGSQDTSNAGVVYLEDGDGVNRETVRYDYETAYINCIEVLTDLVFQRLPKDIRSLLVDKNPKDRKEAREVFQIILKHLHESGIFGRTSLTVVWDWKVEVEKTQEWLKQNAPTFTD